MRNKVIAILFCAILLAGIVTHLAVPDRYYSESEKRTLSQFPALSWKSVRTGKFGDGIEEYLADQFPVRDGWVTVKTVLERLSGKKESGGVYFADDGYLIEIQKGFPANQTMANLTALKMLQDTLEEKGVAMRVMLVPTAAQILAEKLPAYAPNADQTAVTREAEKLGIRLTDVTGALSEHRDGYIYYKTDHHWTSEGAYYAYAAWMRERGAEPGPLSAWQKETLCDDFRGTTYSKVNNPDAPYDVIDAYSKVPEHRVDYNNGNYVTDSIYERKYLEGTDQYAVFLNSNQATTVVSGGGEGRLLILKDSYANCFAQFCVDDFEETHLIDMRFFPGSVKEYIAEKGITEVLVLYNIPNFTTDTGVMRCAG